MTKRLLATVLMSLLAAPSFAAWTTPRTWVATELVTASMMNIHIRDNENALRDYLLGAQDLGATWVISTARPLEMSDTANVAHGMTAVVPTDVYARIQPLSSTAGGVNWNGLSDTDAIAYNISGVIGSTAPTVQAITLRGFKKNGTGVQALANTEMILGIQNQSTSVIDVYGNGSMDLHGAPNIWFDKASNNAITYAPGGISLGIGGINIFGVSSTTATVTASMSITGAISLTGNGAITGTGNVTPGLDNTFTSGSNSNRWSAVWAANGTIQTSDRNAKKNIEPTTHGLADVLRLEPVAFQWKDGDAKPSLGFVAQDVARVIPEAVFPPNNENEQWGMSYDRLVPVLVRAVQELSAKVDQLSK